MTDTEYLDFIAHEMSRPRSNEGLLIEYDHSPERETSNNEHDESLRWFAGLALGTKMIFRARGRGRTLREALEECYQDDIARHPRQYWPDLFPFGMEPKRS